MMDSVARFSTGKGTEMQDIIEIEHKDILWVDVSNTGLIEIQSQDTIHYGRVTKVSEAWGWPASHLAWVEAISYNDDEYAGWALLNLEGATL